ncbi:MAG: LON peptidase substrate-binding domain-containing protein [Silicimonas sp.]|nr:LON peptidase substrate-binding domain-containing protein [Silicimonas sp.]
MLTAANLPDAIPVFPLPGALLLPRSRLPLHIFEPRYLAMIDDTLKTQDRLIGMIQPREAKAEGDPTLHAIGCAGRLTGFSETEDGRYMITLSGVSRFRVKKEIGGFTPYRKCDVSWTGFDRDLGAAEKDESFDRKSFFPLLQQFFEAEELRTDWESLEDAEDELLINSLSMLCPFEPEDKQALLEAPSLVTRRETLVTLIEFAMRGGAEDMLQ